MSPTIRHYRAEDRAACHHVFYRAVHEGAARFYDATQRADWASRPDPDLSKPDKLLDQTVWLAEEDGRITGFMSLTDTGHLDMAFVLPEVMGKGHAAAIYDALMAHARAVGLARVTVDASHLFTRFLRRRGWRVDEAELYVSDRGVAFERFRMSVDLTPADRA